jgi:hypothetical protein
LLNKLCLLVAANIFTFWLDGSIAHSQTILGELHTIADISSQLDISPQLWYFILYDYGILLLLLPNDFL